ncbi:hypothetical protein BN961_01435 [Afipia felis]|uniref:Uncharacterized protein n=1 Tax=Afipia felis TaxID=1035 RepID=A0A090MP30_AFIFE|nr:hypothetical protein BN961_01435 [Afipia felis]
MVAHQLPGEQHILRGNGGAVREPCRRVDVEGDISAGVVGIDAVGEQAVERERLVVVARHQALDHVAADLLHRDAPHDEGIQAVERAEQAPGQAATFRSVWIGIGEILKVIWQRRFAMHGNRGERLSLRPCADKRCAEEGDKRQQEASEREGFHSVPCSLRFAGQWRTLSRGIRTVSGKRTKTQKIIVGIDLSACRCMKAGDSDQSRVLSRIRLIWLRDSASSATLSIRVAALSQKGFSL